MAPGKTIDLVERCVDEQPGRFSRRPSRAAARPHQHDGRIRAELDCIVAKACHRAGPLAPSNDESKNRAAFRKRDMNPRKNKLWDS
jgi:hypothetical protein